MGSFFIVCVINISRSHHWRSKNDVTGIRKWQGFVFPGFLCFSFFWYGKSSMKYISFVTNIHHQNILASKEASFPLVPTGWCIRAAELTCLQGPGVTHVGTVGAGRGAPKVLAPNWGQLVPAGPLYLGLGHFFPPTRSWQPDFFFFFFCEIVQVLNFGNRFKILKLSTGQKAIPGI